jgi:hypothetical protein
MLYSVPLTAPLAAVLTLPKCVMENFTFLMVMWYQFWGKVEVAITEIENLGTLPSTANQMVPSLDSFDVRSQMLDRFSLLFACL